MFRFCVSVQRENFPFEIPSPPLLPPTPLHSSPSPPLPAHTLTLFPPLTVANLLPCDLQVFLGYKTVSKLIRKGKEIAIYFVSCTSLIRIQMRTPQ